MRKASGARAPPKHRASLDIADGDMVAAQRALTINSFVVPPGTHH